MLAKQQRQQQQTSASSICVLPLLSAGQTHPSLPLFSAPHISDDFFQCSISVRCLFPCQPVFYVGIAVSLSVSRLIHSPLACCLSESLSPTDSVFIHLSVCVPLIGLRALHRTAWSACGCVSNHTLAQMRSAQGVSHFQGYASATFIPVHWKVNSL